MQTHLPQFAKSKITHRWAGVMGFARDGEPMVGSIPDDPQVFFAGGYTAHGIGLSFHATKRLVDLVYGREIPSWLSARRRLIEQGGVLVGGVGFLPLTAVLGVVLIWGAGASGLVGSYVISEKIARGPGMVRSAGKSIKPINGSGRAGAGTGAWSYVSASTVEHLHGDLGSLRPTSVTEALPEAALGPAGPLGSSGPLGVWGPIGGAAWNPSALFSLLGDWSGWAAFLTLNGGPLSEEGPLGPRGPLSARAYFETLPRLDTHGMAKQLQAGGAWAVLGPLGPLGALGPLGPLGPLGAHGYATRASGDFVDARGRIVRKVDVAGPEGRLRRFDLVEVYDKERARELADNDTSFMIAGATGFDPSDDVFGFASREDQFVTAVVVPEAFLDHFRLEILEISNGGDARVLAVSSSDKLVNWIQLRARAGQHLAARVTLSASGHFWQKKYRLVVVGSGPGYDSDILGDHQRR